jgi:hypothetical protein
MEEIREIPWGKNGGKIPYTLGRREHSPTVKQSKKKIWRKSEERTDENRII